MLLSHFKDHMIYTFLMPSDVAHFFLCLLAVCISSLEKCVFLSFSISCLDYLFFGC